MSARISLENIFLFTRFLLQCI